MYRLKLIKGKTYCGRGVKASQSDPIVCISDIEQANRLVQSGFLVFIENPNETARDESEEDFLFPEEEPVSEESPMLMELQQKTKAELMEYAENRGISVTGCKTKDDVITKIAEEMERASATREAIRED